jgi:DNA adenine methylase
MKRLPAGRFKTYAEPFCGGGAMFFALSAEPKRRFERALLSDKNEELVALYLAIQSDVEKLIDRVRAYSDAHFQRNDEERREHFYRVRKLDTAKMDNVERGARFLFLNKTCFNGLWRVNAAGRFNVPFGTYANPKILDVEGLRAAHEALKLAEVRRADFAELTKELEAGDFVYFDPPYVPVSRTANFTAYASDRFGPEEQARLAKELVVLKKRCVNAMLSNAATEESRALYQRPGLYVDTIQAARAINSDPSKRGDVTELVVTTYRIAEGRAAAAGPAAKAIEPPPPAKRPAKPSKAAKPAKQSSKSAKPAKQTPAPPRRRAAV